MTARTATCPGSSGSGRSAARMSHDEFGADDPLPSSRYREISKPVVDKLLGKMKRRAESAT